MTNPTYDLLDDLLGKLRADQHKIINELKKYDNRTQDGSEQTSGVPKKS